MTVIKKGTAQIDPGDDHPLLGPYSAERISDTGNLTQFGALIETLPPGSKSSVMHWHSNEDEMIFVLSGQATLHQNDTTTALRQGDAACFKAGDTIAHYMENTSDQAVRYLVIGTRSDADTVTYPNHNRILIRSNGARRWTDLDGNPANSIDDMLLNE